MSCVLTSGFTLGCRDKTGGIQKVYIGLYNGPSLTYAYGTDNIIGTFSGATVSFYTFEQELEVASFVQTGNFNSENGTSGYTETLEITLQGLTAALRNQILILGQGKWRIIILDQGGRYWLMGKQNPVRVSISTPGLGKVQTDLNGAKLTFEGKEPEPAHEVASAAALSVIV